MNEKHLCNRSNPEKSLIPWKTKFKKKVSTNNNFTSTLDRLQPKSLSSKKGKIVNCPKVNTKLSKSSENIYFLKI